jgi:D-methionine transport system substrate-binding protein
LAVPADIISNPRHIQIREIEAAQLPRVLPDVDLAIINTNYAALADLSPERDALFVEGKDSPYANIIVVRSNDVNNPKLQLLVEALHSPEVKAAAVKLFKGQAVPAW